MVPLRAFFHRFPALAFSILPSVAAATEGPGGEGVNGKWWRTHAQSFQRPFVIRKRERGQAPDPLTRPALAEESASAGLPLPQEGEGQEYLTARPTLVVDEKSGTVPIIHRPSLKTNGPLSRPERLRSSHPGWRPPGPGRHSRSDLSPKPPGRPLESPVNLQRDAAGGVKKSRWERSTS